MSTQDLPTPLYNAQRSLTAVTAVLTELRAATTKINSGASVADEVRDAIFQLEQIAEHQNEIIQSLDT